MLSAFLADRLKYMQQEQRHEYLFKLSRRDDLIVDVGTFHTVF